MGDLYRKFLDRFHINGRDFAVFLLALLLAFSTWLIHNLSLRYNDYITASVVAHCNLDGHSDVSSDRFEVIARCRATGYQVLSSRIRHRKAVADVTFQPSSMEAKGGDVFYVTQPDLQEYAHLIFGDEVTVEYFLTDTLFFHFNQEDFKKVPVKAVTSLSFDRQYTLLSEVETYPDSVIIYGDPYHLENIEMVHTKPIRHYDLRGSFTGSSDLVKIKNVRMSVENVRYSVPVTRFVEMDAVLPVEAVNVPGGKEMAIFPSTVEVKLSCVYPLREDPFENMHLYVDYNDYISSLSGKCVVRTANLARGLIGYDTLPNSVYCVVGDKL